MASHYCTAYPCPMCAASTAAMPIPFGDEIRDLVRRLTDDLHASEADNAALRERVAKLERVREAAEVVRSGDNADQTCMGGPIGQPYDPAKDRRNFHKGYKMALEAADKAGCTVIDAAPAGTLRGRSELGGCPSSLETSRRSWSLTKIDAALQKDVEPDDDGLPDGWAKPAKDEA